MALMELLVEPEKQCGLMTHPTVRLGNLQALPVQISVLAIME